MCHCFVWGTINIQRDDQSKMKQHNKNKSIIIAVIATQAGSQALDLGSFFLAGRDRAAHRSVKVAQAADSWRCAHLDDRD